MMNLERMFLSFLIIIFFAISASTAQENNSVFPISPMASPVSTLSSYADLIQYLSEESGIKIILKQRRRHVQINSLLNQKMHI
jgi:hypothetical protein